MTGPKVCRPTNFADMVQDLSARAIGLAASGRRRLLGITGSPGAGKSTLCAALVDALGPQAVLVGMDAFHLSNQELIRLARRDRKGAPDTFDVAGYASLLRRARQDSGAVIYAPRFDRSIEESIGASVPILPQTPLVVTEGNYLLASHNGWEHVRPALDEVWYLDVPEEIRKDRLIKRHFHFGKSMTEAQSWTEQVDLQNAAVIEQTRHRADLIVEVPDAPDAGLRLS